jgi:3-oxoadipate enol-lactonase
MNVAAHAGIVLLPCAMIDPGYSAVGSATKFATSQQTTPVFAQAANAPVTKRGFLERPGCRVCYEVTGSGPPIIFAHGIGSNHLTWWQQVPYFADRFTCVTFSHRGYLPGTQIGVPDPKEFGGDLAALIEHLKLPDVRLVAQSMGGCTSLEYILTHPQHRVRALVLASTCGTIHRSSAASANPQRFAEWTEKAVAARADMTHRGIAPPAGERMVREQPELHFLYREIAGVSATFDREELRPRVTAMSTRPPETMRGLTMPTLFLTAGEDRIYAPFLSDALAALMPNAKVEHVAESGHSIHFERAKIFNRLVDGFLSKHG